MNALRPDNEAATENQSDQVRHKESFHKSPATRKESFERPRGASFEIGHIEVRNVGL